MPEEKELAEIYKTVAAFKKMFPERTPTPEEIEKEREEEMRRLGLKVPGKEG